MADALILTKRDDGVAIVSTNDDPLNRMTLEYVDMFSDVVEDIAADDSIRSFVVTAEGTTNFSVGMNLKQLPEGLKRAGSVDAFFDQRLALISRIETMGKPSVATLFGHCLGGGIELPLGCTFRLAAEEGANIGLPEMDLGSTPAWGGSARLAVRGMLAALHDAEHKTVDELLVAERAAVHATMGTPDAAEGMKAFLEKRPPVFNQPVD